MPPLSSPDFRWLAYLLARDFTQEPFPHRGFTAHDSAGRFDSLLFITVTGNSRKSSIDLTTPSAISSADELIPSGRLQEAWRSSLGPRQSGHGIPHPTVTIAVLVPLPSESGKTLASVTALLTFPMVEFVNPEDVHVTWIFHQ